MRYRVIVTLIVNVVINVDLGTLDLDVLIWMQRQGPKTSCSKRLNVSSRLLSICLKGLRFSSSKSSLILAFSCASEQNRQCRRRARIQRSTICTDTSTLALILRTGRQYYNAIMLRPLLITWIQLQIVTAGFAHGRSEIVANHDIAAAIKEIDHPGMACQLVKPRLPPNLPRHKCSWMCAKHAEKHSRLTHLVGLRIVHRNGATTVINIAFVGGLLSLAHRAFLPGFPDHI